MVSSSWNQPTNIMDSPNTTPLLPNVNNPATAARSSRRRPITVFLILFGILALAFMVGPNDCKKTYGKLLSIFINVPVVSNKNSEAPSTAAVVDGIPAATVVARGVSEGVSAKSFRPLLMGLRPSYSWTNQMLNWQRTAFHFQPNKNWMNDPNGPLLYKGWYHFFYQYNPDGPVWGNIVWGHAVSKDLIHWHHLPIAMTTDQWYDINGVWTGSATLLSDGQVVMLYTGSTKESVQVQNLAYPANPSDPLLQEWVKYPGNPVLVPPPGIHFKDFRDPTTAWTTSDGKWRFIIGSKLNKTGISLVYDTTDFKTFQLSDMVLHAVPGTGMWECVDFYPVSRIEENGLDTSINGPAVKHVMKVSLDDDRNDYYAIGTYDEATGTWVPDDPTNDVGIGLRYDYGTFYASKTFYDHENKRRILWSWVTEKDSEAADIKKGWASLQAIPRTVVLDKKTGSNLLQWPVEEVEKLRLGSKTFDNVRLDAGSFVSLDVHSAAQLDIIAEFEINEENIMKNVSGIESGYSCSSSNGAAQRGALGPFGLLVLADKDQVEQTPVYFYLAKGTDGNLKTFFCADHSRSSLAYDVEKKIHGSSVPVLKGEKFTVRILVDHSIIESFAQGGRTCITSRVYPTKSIYDEARLFLFNNATDVNVSASVKVWQMSSTNNSQEHSNSNILYLNNIYLYLCFILFMMSC